MKKLLPVILLLFFIQVLSRAQMDTSAVVYSWKLDQNFDNMIRVEVDTNLENFQVYNPALQKYFSIATLGNYSLPTISNLFTERNLEQEYILTNAFYPYMKLFWNTNYINTRKPFSKLTYMNGGSSQNKQEILDAFHSQNISNVLNAGFHFTTVRALGQYSFQKTKNNAVKLFSSFTGNRYSYHFNINFNKIVADENGGITDDSSITDTTYSRTKDIPTLFGGIDNPPAHEPDVFNEIRNIRAFTIQEVSFRTESVTTDSIDTNRKIRIFYPKLAYIFYFDRNVKLFYDKNPMVGFEKGLYKNVLVNKNSTEDSLYYWKLFNGIRLKFQGRQTNRYFIDFAYEIMRYSMTTPSEDPAGDTLRKYWFISDVIQYPSINYNNRLFNTHISSGFSKIFANHLEMSLYGRFYLSGYRKGDLLLSGEISVFTDQTESSNRFIIKAINELKAPDFLLTHYASNNFIWTRNFRKTGINYFSTTLDISSKKFELKGDYYLFRDFIFFNEEAIPEQYPDNLSVLVLSMTKQFDFWKITSLNRLAYQAVNKSTVLSLPALILNSSTYLKHMFNFKATGGKLLTMIGFDLKYNTKYYASAYMPPLSTFYQQNEKKLGNYPYIDVFLNIQLKRFRLFLKYYHVNSGWINSNYFTVLHYPMNRRYLEFGLSWIFYN